MVDPSADAGEVGDSGAHVLPLLREQATLLGRIESLAPRQRELVQGEDVGPLLSMLAERAKLSHRLAEVGSRLAPIRRAWTAHRERLSPREREEAERLICDAGVRLRRVLSSDEADARILSGRREAVAESLRSAQIAGRAIDAYRTPAARAERPGRVAQQA